jgi:hypothetical protein
VPWVFSFSFFAGVRGAKSFVLTGLKTRHYKNCAFSGPRFIALGGKQVARTRKNKRAATGLSPGMNCLPHFAIALRRKFTFAAYRPAGTREALPGTICETFVPHFLFRALAAVPVIQRKSYP